MPTKAQQNITQNTFQDNFQQLKMIIERMERNDIPLEELTDIFRKGQDLLKSCEQQLQTVTHSLTQEINDKS